MSVTTFWHGVRKVTKQTIYKLKSRARKKPTCTADETETIYCVGDSMLMFRKPLTVHVMECGACGHTFEHVNGDYEYCPRCGKKRRDFRG